MSRKRSHIEIDESGLIPADGLFFDNGQETRLPYYKFSRMSERETLNLTNCHAAILSTVRKARLLGVEIAYRKEPFWRRRFKTFILEDIPMEFDKLLFFISHQIGYDLDVIPPKSVGERLTHLLRTLLGVDKDFNESSARLKRSVLLVEKNFAQNVVEPLKKALIDSSTVDYPNLEKHATRCREEITPAFKLWQEEVRGVLSTIMGLDPLKEAAELNKKIDDLLEQAQEAGWDREKDEKFKELDESNAFQRPDGPSSIITYLTSVLSSNKHQSPTKQRVPSTSDLSAGKVGMRREEYSGKMLRSSPRKKRAAPSEPRPSTLKRPRREGR